MALRVFKLRVLVEALVLQMTIAPVFMVLGKVEVNQWQRYIGVKSGMAIRFKCYITKPHDMESVQVQWSKQQDGKTVEYLHTEVIACAKRTDITASYRRPKVTLAHSGVYYCSVLGDGNVTENGTGTELKVYGFMKSTDMMNKNAMKEAIIFMQMFLLLAILIASVVITLGKIKNKADPEEYNEEHTYEGLEIEQVATYEDIDTVRQIANAKWTHGEHPCEE
ncbi:B-cell antigen receptor complex-associated protein beta chain-like [Polypterus senegalus]|uniref:B-cell antigen receptor complex-associated protein beta chain-like n=1 Tax=Polypterus senegalus TaxID=55291 RepID=UPI001965E4D8|nr:B-cell antigen receptor complex-associated protein beta chain-like [Polypterus senegalus]